MTKMERENDESLRQELINRRMEDSEYKWKINKGKVQRGDKILRDRKLGDFIVKSEWINKLGRL